MTRCSFYRVRVYPNTVTQRGEGGTEMNFEKPTLQVALDFINLHRTLSVAKEVVTEGTDWIEIRTPRPRVVETIDVAGLGDSIVIEAAGGNKAV